MALDLSALDGFNTPLPAAHAVATNKADDGKAREFPLTEIDEDASQPRKTYDNAKLEELAASIKVSGVITPISIKPNPSKPGRWIINYGHRRFRASLLAGKKTIPATVSDAISEYDQVIENLQRDDLTPLEIATFIQKRHDAGDSKSEIATGLGKPPKFVTEHLALIDMPGCIADAYANKTQSPATICNLRALHKKHPEAVEAWCQGQSEITRRTVDELASKLKGQSQKPDNAPSPSAKMDEAGSSSNFGNKDAGDGKGPSPKSNPTTSEASQGDQNFLMRKSGGGHDDDRSDKKMTDSDEITDPVLFVEHKGIRATVLLDRRPTRDGLFYIRYEGDGTEAEVECSDCTALELEDRAKISS